MAGEPVDGRLHRLAAHQHGVFSRSQGLNVGADDRLLSRRTMAGRLERVAPGVYRVPGYPSSFRQQTMTAILGAGSEAAASHRTAAALLRLDGVAEGVVELSVPAS